MWTLLGWKTRRERIEEARTKGDHLRVIQLVLERPTAEYFENRALIGAYVELRNWAMAANSFPGLYASLPPFGADANVARADAAVLVRRIIEGIQTSGNLGVLGVLAASWSLRYSEYLGERAPLAPRQRGPIERPEVVFYRLLGSIEFLTMYGTMNDVVETGRELVRTCEAMANEPSIPSEIVEAAREEVRRVSLAIHAKFVRPTSEVGMDASGNDYGLLVDLRRYNRARPFRR